MDYREELCFLQSLDTWEIYPKNLVRHRELPKLIDDFREDYLQKKATVLNTRERPAVYVYEYDEGGRVSGQSRVFSHGAQDKSTADVLMEKLRWPRPDGGDSLLDSVSKGLAAKRFLDDL